MSPWSQHPPGLSKVDWCFQFCSCVCSSKKYHKWCAWSNLQGEGACACGPLCDLYQGGHNDECVGGASKAGLRLKTFESRHIADDICMSKVYQCFCLLLVFSAGSGSHQPQRKKSKRGRRKWRTESAKEKLRRIMSRRSRDDTQLSWYVDVIVVGNSKKVMWSLECKRQHVNILAAEDLIWILDRHCELCCVPDMHSPCAVHSMHFDTVVWSRRRWTKSMDLRCCVNSPLALLWFVWASLFFMWKVLSRTFGRHWSGSWRQRRNNSHSRQLNVYMVMFVWTRMWTINSSYV